MRKGTLTDAETLVLYETGTSMLALCIHEGLTPYGVISRLGRARRARGAGIRRSTRRPQATYTTLADLRSAVAALARETRKLSNGF